MAEIRWTEEAHRWLRDIHDYIAADNPAAAQKVVSGIYDKAQMLRSFPEIGHRYRAEAEGEIRILLYGHYRIAYLLKSPCSIDILGVFHGALDIDRYFP
ncbi:type II toxin-antitoxin system RelE/ParE family toxin [Thioalkalivibrio nitratireducens]|uniref:type II toxin-antitoxin system RelE/ParE family toxin n=1 Tax=Thioalkalivibrio nitratireducens TaxID=186931 RepID=UPI0005C22357|nr:type II toxin-antitoxin system RelE/ParE family toxin [Thioalkalivibrio nitratireducens]